MYDCTMIKSYVADKIHLHDYCIEKLGKDICIPIIAVYDRPEQIDFSKLPDKFIAKCNHGSAMNIIVENKNKVNRIEFNNKFNKWLNYKYGTLSYEYHYDLITPKIIIEEFKDNGIDGLIDYKFWCFNGKPLFYSINGGHGHGAINYYDLDGSFYKYQRIDAGFDENKKWEKPKTFNKMLEYAETLSKDFKLVRVDFYEIDEKTYLGELTFTPGAGYFNFTNNGDLILGEKLDLQ